jgi:flavin reductase (DIM6/NTAB) family NADH-FMN oxidoreductase RutF
MASQCRWTWQLPDDGRNGRRFSFQATADRWLRSGVHPMLKLITEPEPTAEVTSAEEFADAMSVLASGVALVTCWLDGRPWGMTVTAFASVSVDPPTVLVSLASRSPAARAIDATGRFGVSILAEEQLGVARHGSAPGKPKFLEPFADADGRSVTPVVANALAHLDCELAEAVRIADHTVYFGRVREARMSRSETPLLYHRRAYWRLAEATVADRPNEWRTGCLSN